MKLTQLSQALVLVLVAFLAYTGWQALQLQRENSSKMQVLTNYIDALAAQMDAQKKAQAETGVAGLVTPMDFGSTPPPPPLPAVNTAAAGSAPTVTVAPAAAPVSATAGSAPTPPPAPPPVVETPLMKVVKNASSIASVTTVDTENGFVTLNAGSKNQLKTGQSFHLRRGSSVVGLIKVSLVEESEAAADLDMKSVPAGVKVQAGDEVIQVVNLQ
jgi:hypothetical protein